MNEFQMTGDQMQMKSAIVQLMKAGSPDSTVEEELRNFVAVLTAHNLSEEEMKFQVLEILTEGRLQRELLLKSAQSTPVANSRPKALSILTDWRHSLDLHQEALPILCATTPLQEKASDDLMWSDLKELYNEVNADGRSEGRVLASLINSILTQNRYYFCMTREKTRELVTKDTNHIGDVAFDNWRGQFPKGPFWPVSRSSGDRYQRSSKGPLRFGHGIALAIVGFERANATPIFFE